LIQLTERHDLSPHLYADDTQVHGSCRPSTTAQLLDRMSECLADVAAWMLSNNKNKNNNNNNNNRNWYQSKACMESSIVTMHVFSIVSKMVENPFSAQQSRLKTSQEVFPCELWYEICCHNTRLPGLHDGKTTWSYVY